jgi:hypothetical protein
LSVLTSANSLGGHPARRNSVGGAFRRAGEGRAGGGGAKP